MFTQRSSLSVGLHTCDIIFHFARPVSCPTRAHGTRVPLGRHSSHAAQLSYPTLTRAHTRPQAEPVGNGRGNTENDNDDDDDGVEMEDDSGDYHANSGGGGGYGARGGDTALASAEAVDADDVQARVAAYGRLSGKTNKVQVPSLPKPRAQKVRCVSVM